MEVHDLKIPKGYDPAAQRVIGTFLAQLDDQSAALRRALGTPSIAELEWQLESGMNSIGMLLANNAIVEAFWINVAPLGIGEEPEGDRRVREITGIGGNDDGIPLASDGKHPDSLRGLNLDDYLRMMDSARKATHSTVMGWTDAELDESYTIDKYRFTKIWTIYHVLEHFIGHLGQIKLLKHVIKDRGLV
jgi:hypothetical protein